VNGASPGGSRPARFWPGSADGYGVAVDQPLGALTRPVRLLAAGGTIAMGGAKAVPALDAHGLIEAVPALRAVPALEAETVLGVPSAHLSLAQALDLCERAAAAAADGEGVVISTGTDTLEEVAVLCALVHGAESPIVVTGANRPATGPGADGPANLIDAVVVAGSETTAELGTVVVFGGEIHDAMTVRKVDSTSPAAFGSPISGPLGRVVERRVWLHTRPPRRATLEPRSLEHRVEIISPALGDDGSLLRHAADHADGIVLVAFGAGHLSPVLLAELRRALERVPVVLTCRPERSSMLVATYGFEGAEPDLRASGAACAPFLSPPAARIALLCCLGAGLDRPEIGRFLAPWDLST
jgi:L-asparaginase